jgi:hypothetical protein
MTAVQWFYQRMFAKDITSVFEQAKEMENIEKLKKELFIGKVSEIIGFEKTVELLKQCNETFNK